MMLQDPPLKLYPIDWKPAQETKFNDKCHKRVLGSDRNCKNILYHVWPAVARNGVILGDQKIDVVLRNELYTPFKIKRGSVASTVSTVSNVDIV